MEVCADGASYLVDGRAAGGKIRHHLGSHFGGISRHALLRDPVIAHEHKNVDAIEARHASPLPTGEPKNDIFEPPQAARRLGELALPFGRERCGINVWRRQSQAPRTQLIERREQVFRLVGERWAHGHARRSLEQARLLL